MLLTERLKLRALEDSDSGLIIELLNDPAFLEYIGDRGVRSADQAREYIAKLRAARTTHGYALYGVALLHENTLIGLCGLVRRDTLPNADLGFAFLPAYRKNGYTHAKSASRCRQRPSEPASFRRHRDQQTNARWFSGGPQVPPARPRS